jgi:alpha-amylase
MNQDCIEYCRLAGLADLDQSNSYVSDYLANWVKNMIQTYNIDGIRIDTIPEVQKDFWKKYVDSAGVYAVGEVFNGDMNYLAGYVPYVGAVLNYPFFFTMRDLFAHSKDMWGVKQFYSDWASHLSDISALAVFADNHDNARFLSDTMFSGTGLSFDNRIIKYKPLLVFTLTSTGIPIVYYGTEQHFAGGNDPYDREPLWNNLDTTSDLYNYIKTIN